LLAADARRWSYVLPVEHDSSAALFSGSVGDAEATALQRNNFSQLIPFSDGDLL
jgi:hypothetical protein